MPDPSNKWGSYDFRNFFSVAKKVMFPGGKVFFTTESPEFISFVGRLAKEEGMTPGRASEITRPEEIRTADERNFKRQGHKIFRFAITNGRPWVKNRKSGN